MLPETSAPSPGAFQEAFLAAAADGYDGVLCINLSSEVSATYQAAVAAAKAVGDQIPVRTIDSRSLTMGLGLMVLDAAEMAADGATLDELADRVEALIARTQVFGVVDTLEHLEKGGRIGGARALLGSLLSIKPVVSLVDGVVEEESKQRTRGRSLRYLADKAVDSPPIRRMAVCNGAADRHRRVPRHAQGRAVRAPAGGGRPRTGGRHPHRPGHHRGVHDHRRLNGHRPRTGRPGGEPDYPRTMDPQPESPATRLPGSGALGDLPTRGTDLVETLVTLLRDKTVRPLTLATRAIVFGIIIFAASVVTVVLVSITLIRLLTVYAFDGRVWLSDLVVGAVFVVVGLVAWSQRTDPAGPTEGAA